MVTNGNGNVNSKVAYMCVSFRCHCHHKMGPQTIYQWCHCHCHQSPYGQSHMFALNPFMTTKQRFRCSLPSQLERALWTNLQCQLLFFEEGKRSLRRLSFYTCLSVILFTWGGGLSRPMPMGGLCLRPTMPTGAGVCQGGCPGPGPWGCLRPIAWGGCDRGGVHCPGPGHGVFMWMCTFISCIWGSCLNPPPPPQADGYCCGR